MSTYLKGLKAEWNKLIWPSNSELKRKTSTVITISVILGCVVAVSDYAFQSAVNFITSLF